MQKKRKIELYDRNVERLLLGFVTVILAVMVWNYYNHIEDDLAAADKGYQDGSVVNLAAPLSVQNLERVFKQGGYFTDQQYINFITRNLKQKVDEEGRLPNLGALNKDPLLINATAFLETASESGKLRFINALAYLGLDSALYDQEKKAPPPYPSKVDTKLVNDGVSVEGDISFKDDRGERGGVLIRLTKIFPDIYFDTLAAGPESLQTIFYARTDAEGHYEFNNLEPEGNYSVAAIKPGFNFGTAKGSAAIGSDRRFDFVGKPHQIRLLDGVAYRQIKQDKVLTVRTPDEFKKEFFTYIIFFVLGFWLLHVALYLKNYRSDQFILPLIMFISGIGTIVLYSIQDPLSDEIYGTGMAKYAALVLGLFTVLIFVFKANPVNRFYHSQWFDPVYKWLPFAHQLKAPRGYTWLLASIGLMLLLAIFGSGPEGSGVKVNLFGLQVSELSKYLMVVFFAAYFTVNAGYFRNIPDNRWLIKNNLLMFGLLLFLLAIYAVLGDLGPAIVLCLTFLFFYSFAKEEFFEMMAAAALFGLLLFLTGKFLNTPESNYLPWLALLACAVSFGFAFFRKKYESVFFIILIISSFILLAALPFSFTERLADRNGMFANIWENQLLGGDQVAQGVWSLNSGGILGQGLGRGLSNVMPAHHTDMILQSIGEELGMVTLIALFFAFGLLVYRCILAARRTGKSFMFYLMAGVAIATMLQLILIGAGSLGLLPLTGISVPFLSKGNAGIIFTLIAFLFVLVMSNERGEAIEMEYVKKHFDNVNAYAILSFFAVVFIFTGCLIWYQLKSDEYITKPALVLNRQGAWQYSYNPRISLMLREIKAGNIYDRNGVLLATSDRALFEKNRIRLLNMGADAVLYKEQLARPQDRYYPFGSDLLFWLGDYNKEIAKEEHAAYAAEYRHFTTLRGFEVHYTSTQRTTTRFKENKFLPETTTENELSRYDYSALAPFIKAGKNSELIKAQSNKKKDIWLSMDVLMNEKINSLIQSQAPYKDFRTSVVAVNSKTGDVLASAANPSPSYKDQKLISNIQPEDYRNIYKQIFHDRMVVPRDLGLTFASRPGSTVKIIDAYAAFNQYGLDASRFNFFVYPAEVIRADEPSNVKVDMHQAIVRSSNVYFIKLANEKKLQASLFHLYDLLGMNIINRGGFNFKRPEDYNSEKYFKEWNSFLDDGRQVYFTKNRRLVNTRKRFQSHYSNIAWGQGELMATPLHLAKMSGAIANKDSLMPSRFLFRSWNEPEHLDPALPIAKHAGASNIMAGFMKEQSAKAAAATGLAVYGKTGSPERDKIIIQNGKTIRKRVTDAWYTFYVPSPKLGAPIAFTIRIEEIGNSEFAKQLAIDMLKRLKASGYF
ncbi:FtsW/RodA/SpoVE family cell cycle protein [Niabella insulamsoli]|uniref:FtsW/RodA/SpoVE family cell cycle protein n=1 Tax=Niabella insulamsoli TaxID=3144874 RepID=UPI0031FDE2D6